MIRAPESSRGTDMGLLTWTLRMGLVVHRESFRLSDIQNLRGQTGEGHYFTRVSADTALFAVPGGFASSDDAGLVTKGRVVIKGGHAEIVYRAAVGPTIFLILWFGMLIAGEIGIWFFPPGEPLTPALAVVALLAGAALVVRHTVRVEVGRLRGIALEAASCLRDDPRIDANHER